jgi:hypothetical protein
VSPLLELSSSEIIKDNILFNRWLWNIQDFQVKNTVISPSEEAEFQDDSSLFESGKNYVILVII